MELAETVPGDRTLCLTFDDGPNPGDTQRLLAVLRRHQIAAVFFLVGQFALEHPGLVRAIVADGHALGNHTMHHDDLSGWSKERVAADLSEATEAIRSGAPGAAVPYFRAPYGNWGYSPDVARALGLRPLGWRLAVGDWDPPGTGVLVERIRAGASPGAIVLLHDGGGDRRQTVDAVDAVVPVLRSEGWSFALPPDPDGPLTARE
jgi:peptidoglycan/xylan/chitin deacetylase (PgdA/CDA1 family)